MMTDFLNYAHFDGSHEKHEDCEKTILSFSFDGSKL
jgi:hypothetical protein